MLCQPSSLSYLPENIWVSIFERTRMHPSLCTVSKDVQRIMETVYANLYRDYHLLNHHYLNLILQKVERQQVKERPTLFKVRLVYEAVMRDIETLIEGEEIEHRELTRYEDFLSVQHIQTLTICYEKPLKAISLIACFQKIAKECSNAQQFLQQLPTKNRIHQASRIRAWMKANTAVLKEVKQLNLANLNLIYLPKEVKYLTRLQILLLTNNALAHLLPEIGSLTKLRQLCLGSNQLKNLPAEIGKLSQLIVLSLYDNAFTSLPKEIVCLVQLRYLELSKNTLTSLPKEIGHLTRLEGLCLNCNRIANLPAEMGDLIRLQRLKLRGNQLTSLPVEVGNLAQLCLLDLGGNQLINLPAEIGHLTQLQNLFLDNNNLTSLPKEFIKLKNLILLTLIHNVWREEDFPQEVLDYFSDIINDDSDICESQEKRRVRISELFGMQFLSNLRK